MPILNSSIVKVLEEDNIKHQGRGPGGGDLWMLGHHHHQHISVQTLEDPSILIPNVRTLDVDYYKTI